MLNFNKFISDESGVTLVEYGIALILAVSVGVTALTFLAEDIEEAIEAAKAEMPG